MAIALLTAIAAAAATNDLTTLVQKGLFEEEANRNLDAAVASYQSAINSYDSDRQLAATAVFRLGECYRKLGRTNEATAEYERLIRDFGDQTNLVELARGYVPNAREPERSDFASIPTPEEQKQLAATEQMIKTSPDLVNSSRAPLVAAARAGWISVARLLLDNGANPNVMEGGALPLSAAAMEGHKEMVRLLLEHGAEVDGRDHNKKSALDYAAENGFEAVAEVLLGHHADPNSALAAAFVSGQDNMAKFLLAHGAAINGTNQAGETPMIAAINANRPAVVTFLLKSGANPNAPQADGCTPLGAAILHHEPSIADLLLTNGADPNTPFAAEIRRDDTIKVRRVTPLLMAVVSLTPARGTWRPGFAPPLNGRGEDRTSIQIVTNLLDHGANPNFGDEDGVTPLDYAILLGKGTNVICALLQGGANVNALDNNGLPPLAFVNSLPFGSVPREEIQRLLQQAGASENYLRLKGIYWTVKGTGSIGQDIQAKSEDNPPPTVLELIARAYTEPNFAVAFPDLAHITLDRLRNGTNESTNLDLTPALQAGDCAAAPKLDWGDVLEIPEKDHRLDENWDGFSQGELSNLVRCVTRKVRMIVKGQTNELLLLPQIAREHLQYAAGGGWPMVRTDPEKRFDKPTSSFSQFPSRPVHLRLWPESNLYTFDLSKVVHDSGLLLLSSDLTRVQVRRADGSVRTFNLESSPPPAFTLREGDEIDVPEKGS